MTQQHASVVSHGASPILHDGMTAVLSTPFRPAMDEVFYKKDEDFFTYLLTGKESCDMIVMLGLYLLWGCGCSGGGSPSANFLVKPRLLCHI